MNGIPYPAPPQPSMQVTTTDNGTEVPLQKENGNYRQNTRPHIIWQHTGQATAQSTKAILYIPYKWKSIGHLRHELDAYKTYVLLIIIRS